MDSNNTDQLLIMSFVFADTTEKMCATVHQLFIHFKTASESVKREVLYVKFLVKSVKVNICLSYAFPIQNGLKQGDVLMTLLLSFILEYSIMLLQENQDRLQMNRT
jgi:hypothetical protein